MNQGGVLTQISEDNDRSRDGDDENCTTYQVRIPLVLRLDESSRTVFALSRNDL